MKMSSSLSFVTLITLIVGLLAVPASWAQQAPTKGESVKPGINDRYLAPDMKVAEWVDRFEGESREIFVSRQAITEAVQLKPGSIVADIGAGTGLFTALFAGQVGADGQVYAVDLAPKFVEHLRDRAAEKGLDHVTVVLGHEDSITLPQDSIDIAFVCDVYHHFEYPQASLASIYRALRPGGTFVVIDFERIPGTSPAWIFEHVRAGKEVVTEEVQTAGFHLVEEISLDGLTENYFLRFTKP
jgi:ubiquinone/menaquinone biosynthesis C-methylase UbiE